MMSRPLSPPSSEIMKGDLLDLRLLPTTKTSLPKEPLDDEEKRCKYKTGKCPKTRTFKANGKPHQLCSYHRKKANQNQRKCHTRKRQLLDLAQSSSNFPSSRRSTSSIAHIVQHMAPNFVQNSISQSFVTKQQCAVSGTPPHHPSRPEFKTRASTDIVPPLVLPLPSLHMMNLEKVLFIDCRNS